MKIQLDYLPGEKEAIEKTLEYGKQYGYGNLIDNLQRAWSESLQKNLGFNKKTADRAAWMYDNDKKSKIIKAQRALIKAIIHVNNKKNSKTLQEE